MHQAKGQARKVEEAWEEKVPQVKKYERLQSKILNWGAKEANGLKTRQMQID